MKRWDRHEIKAEVHRRGSDLQQIARAAGLNRYAGSVAVHRRHFGAERAIAAFLGVPLHELWPDRYSGVSAFVEPQSSEAKPRAPVESAG